MSTKEATVPPKAPAKEFQMPRPYVGEVVLHRLNRGGEATPALVQRVGEKAVSLLVLPEGQRNGTPRDGVRYLDDPDFRPERDDTGCWDFTAGGKFMRQNGLQS